MNKITLMPNSIIQ